MGKKLKKRKIEKNERMRILSEISTFDKKSKKKFNSASIYHNS